MKNENFIDVPKGTKIIVCGDIHAHPDQFFKLVDLVQPNSKLWLVSVGDILDKGYGIKAEEEIINKFIELVGAGVGFLIKGNHELKHLRKIRKGERKSSSALEWVDALSTSLSFSFGNGSRLTVVHGGVAPFHTWDNVLNDIETCYIRLIDDKGKHVPFVKEVINNQLLMKPKKAGKVWHEIYDGRFGFIASGHDAQKDGIPKFYNFSCNLDCAVYHTGKLAAQEFTETCSLGELIIIEGKAKYPKLEELLEEMAKVQL